MAKNKMTKTASFDLKIGDDRVAMSATVPDAKVPAVELIPVYQQLTNDVVSYTVAALQKSGENISCKEGCSACCTHPVPVTELEALYLAALVKSLPQARQAKIRQRFEQLLARVKEAGLEEDLRGLPALSKDERLALGAKYFHLKLDCPFLENRSCSIYKDRPLECREFLVTSDPGHCDTLNADEIRHIPSKLRLAPALRKQSQRCSDADSEGWMLMLFSLDWERVNKKRSRKKAASQWLQEFVGLAVNREL